eukprot:TRINITY_DN3086_c0_g4_i1.p1 TRINITY_DN3086_c0_g4~~TRINITY_DN3086_c0_g4_i1.p1  ORF type:complete len:721 (+),score=71.18 TRINITY_DN3086_c0_g4_i1:60-2222(+)
MEGSISDRVISDVEMRDPLQGATREALTQLRRHVEEVSALRADIEALRQKRDHVSLADLQRVEDSAKHVETLMGISRQTLAADALSGEWPHADLEQARSMLGAVATCEEAMMSARAQLNEVNGAEVQSLLDALEGSVRAWAALLRAESCARTKKDLIASQVVLSESVRSDSMSRLIDALLDKASDQHAVLAVRIGKGDDAACEGFVYLDNRLRALLRQDVTADVLKSLRVDVPVLSPSPVPLRHASVRHHDSLPRHSTEAHVNSSGASQPVEQRSSGRTVRRGGSVQLWCAVHVGDEAVVREQIAAGSCDACMRDESDHSVLWHSIAFGHTGLADVMLEAFPPGTKGGVDTTEVHARRGDTLLHLLCNSQPFGAATAGLFKRIAVAMPSHMLLTRNAFGHSFLHIAASTFNFWVITYALRTFPECARTLVCMRSLTPLTESLPQADPPGLISEQLEPLPEYFCVAELLQQDDFGNVPYADVAFDVGPDNAGVASGRFLAHRIIVAAQSPVLFEALASLPLTPLPKENVCAAVYRIDPRIDKLIWRGILQFMYTGALPVAHQNDVEKMADLLRACLLYMLPHPLRAFAQLRLYGLLPASTPHIALRVFRILMSAGRGGSEEVAALTPLREVSAQLVLRSAYILFEGAEPQEACETLDRVVQVIERQVLGAKSCADAAPGISAATRGSQNKHALMVAEHSSSISARADLKYGDSRARVTFAH